MRGLVGEPRLPSLKGKMKAKKAKAIMLTADDLNLDENDIGLKGSPTVVEKIFSPPQREGTAIVLEGEGFGRQGRFENGSQKASRCPVRSRFERQCVGRRAQSALPTLDMPFHRGESHRATYGKDPDDQ